KDAFLDSHDIERQRGITVFADQAIFTYKDSTYYLIDNPGHVDFSPEMERSVQVMDYAIVILSAVEGVEGHTATIWQLLRKHNVPTFFFINKTDRTGADVKNVMQEIQEDFSTEVIDITQSFYKGEMTENLIEFIAERNEDLLELYMDNGYDKELWLNALKALIKENKVYPCASGSALQDIGIVEFLDIFHQLTETQHSSDEAFSGRVYKVRHDEKGTRITFIKSLSGTLSVRDEITYGSIEQELTEKITQIRVYNGNKFKTVEHVKAGELFAVSGLTNAFTGDGLGTVYGKAEYEMVPTLKSKVVIAPSVHIKDALKCFQLLDVEDPSLNVMWEERLQEIHIHVMGAIQL
ncbi:GTP-binding protein, partial [Leptospira santarosai]|nr:GTP-binding protein [Leptospira santarosai]